ncbi:Protocadherin beta-11 [Triplophysa tibetana]|uniref:Protocadherin beta-11 n=1 Tax=Triplophysa tibetana TaxID=1572043 RepID=A0A5A9NNH3_9TELE|nr:Protocadherin beta-11 [Triplophysa tibetana]
MRPGLFVGDVAKDLGLDVKRLVSGRARLVIDDSKQYVELNRNKGHLVVKDRIDREQLCGQKSPCSFGLEILLENPLEFFSVTIEIQDINDHAPVFSKKEITLEISESTPIGTVFLLDTAADPDVGLNSLQSYSLKPTDNFVLKQNSRSDGSKYAEMVLQSVLDREKQSEHSLVLTAVDGGDPQRSGTVKVHVTVLDANDNAPIFTDSTYKASVAENSAKGTLITKIRASDADQGYNGNVTYSFTHIGEDAAHLFKIFTDSGDVILTGNLDYETFHQYELNLQARDPWGLTGASKLVIDVVDVNDNSPIITMTSFSGKIQEDSPPGTVVALISVQDLDSDKNDNAPQVLYPVQSGGSVVAEIVPRSADVGYLVTKVVAVDVDSGQNAWLSYKLQKASDRALFEVGLQNGEIRTVRQVTDKDAVKQRLTVVVEDNGQPSRSATVNVNVALADSFPEVLSEFTDFTHDKEYNDNLTFYLILALVAVSFLFVTCLVVIISVKIYRWRQSRLYGKSNLPVIPYYPPRYADSLGTGTLQHVHNYEIYRTNDSTEK